MENTPLPKIEEKNSRDKLYLTLIIVLVLLGAVLGWQTVTKSSELSATEMKITELEGELDNIVETMMGEGVEVSKESLLEDMQNMLNQYDTLQTDNEEMRDKIIEQRKVIEEQMKVVEENKNLKWELYKYKKQLKTMRGIMQGYIHTIDSINHLNDDLVEELDYTNKELKNVKGQKTQLEDDKKNLQDKVAMGSILQAQTITAGAIRVKSSGEGKATTRASRANQVKVCFTINENKISKKGAKDVYLRVIDPNSMVLDNEAGELFQMEKEKGEYSQKREINYQSEALDLCIYYDLKGKEIPAGDYIVELYEDGARIGRSTFTLK